MAITKGRLQTIVELVIEQRANSKSDIFKYDFSLMQKKLSETQDFDKYGISRKEQRDLLKELDRTKSLQVNYVDEYSYQWKHSLGWLAEYLAPEFNPLVYASDFFINLCTDDVSTLKNKYELASYSTRLALKYGWLTVHYDDKEYRVLQLKEGMTARIIDYSWKHHDSIVSREDLAKAGITKNHKKDSLRAICKGILTTIEGVLKPFIVITANHIEIRGTAHLTEPELKTILEHCGKQKG